MSEAYAHPSELVLISLAPLPTTGKLKRHGPQLPSNLPGLRQARVKSCKVTASLVSWRHPQDRLHVQQARILTEAGMQLQSNMSLGRYQCSYLSCDRFPLGVGLSRINSDPCRYLGA